MAPQRTRTGTTGHAVLIEVLRSVWRRGLCDFGGAYEAEQPTDMRHRRILPVLYPRDPDEVSRERQDTCASRGLGDRCQAQP